MININDLFQRFDFVSNQTQQGYVSPEKKIELAKLASYGLWLERLGLPEQMEFNSAVSRIAYARTKKIHLDLVPFKEKVILSTGIGQVLWSQLPEDCYITNIRSINYVKETVDNADECNDCETAVTAQGIVKYRKANEDIDIIGEDKWSYRTKSTIIKDDFCCPYSTYIDFYFHNPVDAVEVTYLKKPQTPVWAYTIVNGEPVYNPTGSVHLEWSGLLLDAIVARMVKEYAKYTSDQPAMAYAENKIAKGE